MGYFHTTRWSMVRAAAAPEPSPPALEALCRDYRAPVLAYVRHLGNSREEAEDLTQAFFLHLLESRLHARAQPECGRFRSFLLTALRRFLANHFEAQNAAKRGGGAAALDIDNLAPEADPPAADTPEQAFQRGWAMTVIARAMHALREESERAGKAELFAQLAPFLIESPDPQEYDRIAAATGMRRGTLAVAVCRLRQRLQAAVRQELLRTVSSPQAASEELHELREVLGRI
jgi:RNA polymerase sigma factor (sigma-70 family)